MWTKWRQLKDHAKARKSEKWPAGIPFKITLRGFIRFAKQTDYLNRTGQNGSCITVDRINDDRGYVFSENPKINNIQPLTRAENTIKQARRDAIRHKAGYSWQDNYK